HAIVALQAPDFRTISASDAAILLRSHNGSDQNQFAPLLDAIKTNLGSNPDEVSADAGYCSTANLRTLSRRRIKGYIATGRQKHGSKSATAQRPAKPGSLLARMN